MSPPRPTLQPDTLAAPLEVPSSVAFDQSAETVVLNSPSFVCRVVSSPILADTECVLLPADTVPFLLTKTGRPEAVFCAF